MRRWIPWWVLLAACGNASGSAPRALVEDFVERSVAVACEPVRAPDVAPAPGLIADATDSTFLVYPVNETRVVLLDARLTPVQEIAFERDGPAGIGEVQAIAFDADGSVWVADQKARAVKAFGPDGLRRIVRTDFFATFLAGGVGGVFAAAASGGEAGSLLHEMRGDVFEALPVAPLRRTDFLLSMLSNHVALATLPKGGVVAAHTMFEPIAHIWTPTGGTRTVALPYPDEAEAQLDYEPQMPIDEEDYAKMAVGALAISVDRAANEVLFLTRSGRLRNGRPERALIRTDAELRYLRSYLLDVHAGHMVHLSRIGTTIVVDDEDRWFRCTTP